MTIENHFKKHFTQNVNNTNLIESTYVQERFILNSDFFLNLFKSALGENACSQTILNDIYTKWLR